MKQNCKNGLKAVGHENLVSPILKSNSIKLAPCETAQYFSYTPE
ncbi:hypothetical protein ALT721_600056 [Alteromonas alvinellae]